MRTLCGRRATPPIPIGLFLSRAVWYQNLMRTLPPLGTQLATSRTFTTRASVGVSQAQKRRKLVSKIAIALLMTAMDVKDWPEQRQPPLPLAPPKHFRGQRNEMFRTKVSKLVRLHMDMFRQLLLRQPPRQAISRASRHLITTQTL
jgi:hypothetical protein